MSTEKSTVTLFTPNTQEAKFHPAVFIKNKPVKLDRNPKLLGVHFETMQFFSSHATLTAAKAKKKVNVLNVMAGTDWGQDKQTLIITYKTIVRSVLEYGSPIWSPAINETSWTKLQRVKNSALKVATGTYHNTQEEHIHRETKVLALRDHGRMITERYLAACHLPGHPGRKHLDRPPPHRPLKLTTLSYKEDVSPVFNSFDESNDYKLAKKAIHTRFVEKAINNYKPNLVLGRAPPPVKDGGGGP